jgi:hypothetical protein
MSESSKRKWSVSQLGTYAGCGQAWKLEKVDRVPQRQAGWFIQGSAVHAAIEAYERSGRALYVDEAQESYLWHWDNELAQARVKQPSDSMFMKGGKKSVQKDLEDRKELGLTQVAEYISENPVDGLWAPFEIAPDQYSVEVGFEIDFSATYPTSDVVVRGYIDCIKENRQTGEWRIEDWKTGTKTPSDPYQMMTYAIACGSVFRVQPASLGWWMCKDREFVPFDMSAFNYADVSSWYHQLSRGAENEVFLPNPKDCFVCGSKPYCRYGSKKPLPWPPVS